MKKPPRLKPKQRRELEEAVSMGRTMEALLERSIRRLPQHADEYRRSLETTRKNLAADEAVVMADARAGLFVTPTTAPEAMAWLKDAATYLGQGFHPEDAGHEYVGLKDGAPTFTEEEADAFERARRAVFGFFDDPCAAIEPFFAAMTQAQEDLCRIRK